MTINRLLFTFVASITLGTATFASAQIGAGRNYGSNVQTTLETQRQAAQSAGRSNGKNARKSNATDELKKGKSTNSEIPGTCLVAFGIDKYSLEKNGLTALRGCVADVGAVVQTFDYADSLVLLDEKATRDAIFAALNRVAQARYERLIVYFACHGANACGRSFVCPFDALATNANLSELNKLQDPSKVVETCKEYRLLPLAEILSVLKEASAREVLVLFDACRSAQNSDGNAEKGDFMRELIETGKKNDAFDRPNRGAFAVITSCSAKQSASESFDGDRNGGLFTRSWLEGLTTGAADYTGLADGYVTLVEAYNYASSKTASEAQRIARTQTPERYFSNVSNNFVLKIVDEPAPSENETELQFLARTGKILTNPKWKISDNKVGLEALDCVLENIPNDVSARGKRAAARRKLGDYAGALDDYEKIGEKFQLYATRDQNPQNDASSGEEKGDAENAVREYDLLTIIKIEDDRYYVSEVNNVPLERVGWIDARNAGWSLEVNGSNISTATPTQFAQTTTSAQSMISPGRNAATGPRPFVGTLGF